MTVDFDGEVDPDRPLDELRQPEDGTNAYKISAVLAQDPSTGYRAKEIADMVGLQREVVQSVLSRLKNEGLVRHRSPHWAGKPWLASHLGLEEVASSDPQPEPDRVDSETSKTES